MNLSATQVANFRSGLDSALSTLQNQLGTSVFAETLPIVGANLGELATADSTNAGNAGLKKIANFKDAVGAKLAALGSSGASDVNVLKAVNDALKEQGFSGTAKLITGGAFTIDFSDVTGSGEFKANAASDLGMPGLDIALSGTATTKGTVNYDFNFQAGLTGGDAFILQQNEGAEVNISVDVNAGAFSEVAAKMGNLPYLVSAADPNLLAANFAVNLDGAGNIATATIQSGAATPKLKLLTNFGAGAAMPGVGSTLDVAWDLAGATLDANGSNNGTFGAVPVVAFNNIGIDPGKFVSDVAGQFFGNLTTYLDPVIKVATKLATPIPGIGPILDQLGLGGTLIDIIAGKDSTTAKAVKQLSAFGGVVETIKDVAANGGTLVDFGSFTFTTDGSGADIRSSAFSLGNVTPNLTSTGVGAAGSAALTKLGKELNEDLGAGLQFPILNGPGELFKFVLGQPANLITYNPGEIKAGLDFTKSIPVFPGVNVGIAVGGSVGFNLELGFDTRGIVDFANGGFSDSSQLLNGLFLTDFQDKPEMFFEMRIGATASLGIPGIAEGGIEGGIRGTINGDFKDNFNVPGHDELALDNKLSFQEIAHQFKTSSNPLNLFEISGRIEAYLAAYLEFLFYSKRFDLGSFTLFDYEADKAALATATPPKLAGNSTNPALKNTIELYVGPLAGQRESGASDVAENIRVREAFDPETGKVIKNTYVISSAATVGLGGTSLALLPGEVTLKGTLVTGNMGAGNDVLRVSDGIKVTIEVDGGAGRDFLQGGFFKDNISGGSEDDEIYGNGGSDSLFGDGGHDTIFGNEGNDYIAGGEGLDTLYGDAGNDKLFGDTETSNASHDNNTLLGGAGNDTLFGSAGTDLLDGGEGIDDMYGEGADTFVVDHPKDKIFYPDGPGIAIATVLSRISNFTLPDGIRDLRLTFDLSEDGTERIDNPISGTGNALGNVMYGNEGNNTLVGLAGADIIWGEGGADLISGGADNDTLRGGEGNDFILGGDGDDSIIGGDGDDYLTGGPGIDFLQGGAGSDAYTIEAGDVVDDSGGGNDLVASPDDVDLTQPGFTGIEGVYLIGSKNSNVIGNSSANRIVGNAGKNKLTGAAGQDTLEGGTGDTLEGGADNDTYIINGKTAKIVEGDGPSNGARDIIQSTVSYTIPLNIESFLLTGSAGDKSGGPKSVMGNDQVNEIIIFVQGPVSINAQGGNDAVSANFLGIASSSSVTIFGGSGDDYIQGSNFGDLLFGHSPFIPVNDTFSDNDSIDGGLGDDVIYAGKGRDTVDAGIGDDYIHTLAKEISTLRGGLGDDTYEIADGGIFNVLLIDESTGDGIDRLISAVNVDLGATRVGGGTVGRGSIEIIELTGNALNAAGDTSNNTIYGNSGKNLLSGFAGSDTLFGGDGDDILDGRDFFSTAARDELHGGKGNDIFTIAESLDVVVEERNEGTDRVESSVDFVLSKNVEDLFLTGFTAVKGTGNFNNNLLRGNSLANILTALAGNDTVYGGEGGDTITGGVGKDEIHGQGGADVIDAGESDDTIEGNDGADTIRGGGGNDTIFGQAIFTTGSEDNTDDSANDVLFGDGGNDKMYGFGGNDTLDGGDGADTMSGGTGNDEYRVDFAKDKVFEGVGAGIDYIYSSVTYDVPENVEVLVLTGVGNTNSKGTKAGERIVGNVGDNVISGLGGDDILEGGNGRDHLLGGDGNDDLYGDKPGFLGSGDDTLDGGAGDDDMQGGFGNDVYYVDSINDHVFEQAGSGFDTIFSSIGYTAPLSVEELIYTGKGPATLDGAGGPNRIFGGPANDTLNPSAASFSAGIDTLFGGKGDDTYFVNKAADVVSENPGEGKDKVFSMAGSYTLGENVENLTVLSVSGASTTDGTGNESANEIIGSGGSNVLSGLGGNDTLTGGGGSDTLNGGSGDDTFIVQDRDTVILEGILGGHDKAIVQVNNYFLTPGAFVEEIHVAAMESVGGATGNNLANVIYANNFGNGLNGGGGNDTLNGGTGDDYLTGTDTLGILEIDVLTGGAGADHFQLTSGVDTFYNDGIAATTGASDFAWIKDFKPAEGDRITMTGGMSGLVLFGVTEIFSAGKTITGTGLYFDVDRDNILDLTDTAANDELLAFFEGTKSVPTTADIDFIFV